MWRLLLLLIWFFIVTIAVSAKDNAMRERGVLAEMQSVSCGFQQKTGSTVAGVLITGAQHTNSRELLCQEYVLKTDRVTYRIRPKDEKHPVLLPVGESAEFRLKKDKMLLRVPESDNKEREYVVLSMTPTQEFATEINATRRPPKPHTPQPAARQPLSNDAVSPGSTTVEQPQTASATNQSQGAAETVPAQRPATVAGITGVVQVDSTPPGAEIFVDSTPAGRTPSQITLRPGIHAVQVVMPGYKDWVQTVDVVAGGQHRVTANLAR